MKHLLTTLSIISIFTFIIFIPYYIGEFFLQRTPPEQMKSEVSLWIEGLFVVFITGLVIGILWVVYSAVYDVIDNWSKNKK